MIAWVNQGWGPGGGWNLPAEFQHPPEFAFTSDRAQFILEEGGYAGYGDLGAAAPAPSRIPSGTFRTASYSAWKSRLDALVSLLRSHFGGGHLAATTRHRRAEPYYYSGDAHFVAPDGRRALISRHTAVGAPATQGGDFDGQIFYDGARRLASGVASARAARPRGVTRATRRGPAQRFRGYGASIDSIRVHPMGWDRFRHVQGRSGNAMGYRGYAGTMTWDQYANRLTVPPE